MDVDSDHEAGGASGGAGPSGAPGKEKKRFEVKQKQPCTRWISLTTSLDQVKKWNAVALWAWDIVVDNCAICR